MMPTRAHILIVDDHVLNRTVLQETLEAEGHVVIHATSGFEAFELVKSRKIDLVLLDIMLPGLDGIELCRRIRAELLEWTLPIIALTAVDDAERRAEMKAAGADDFLRKPVHRDELLARVRNLLMLRAYYDLSEQLRIQAEDEAKRWRLISDIAAAVANTRTYVDITRALAALLGREIDIDGVAYFEVQKNAADLMASSTAHACWGDVAKHLASTRSSCLAEIEVCRPQKVISLPVFSCGVLQGYLCVSCANGFDSSGRALLTDLATHLSNSLANVRSHVKSTQLDEARRRFTQLLVHDFKNPLQILQSNVEFLLEESIGGESADVLTDCRAALGRLQSMVQELLDVGRAEDGRLPFQPAPVALRDVVNAALASVTAGVTPTNVRFELEVDPHIRACIDASLVRRVIERIIGNGLRNMPTGGVVTIRATPQGGALTLVIANDGPSLAAEDRDDLFKQYGTLSARPNNYRSFGVYFCRLAIERHGGTIRVSEPPDGGVEFTIHLPHQQQHSVRTSRVRAITTSRLRRVLAV